MLSEVLSFFWAECLHLPLGLAYDLLDDSVQFRAVWGRFLGGSFASHACPRAPTPGDDSINRRLS
jgi:hypothetical protein